MDKAHLLKIKIALVYGYPMLTKSERAELAQEVPTIATDKFPKPEHIEFAINLALAKMARGASRGEQRC